MKLAVKLLSKTDLTLFEPVFRARSRSKQKGVNLNSNVMRQLFPALPPYVAKPGLGLTLDIYGPGGAPLQRESSKLTKGQKAKNWRLAGGSLIPEPLGQAGRYSTLAAGDIAIFGFTGDPLPEVAALALFSKAEPADANTVDRLRTELGLRSGTNSMVELSPGELTDLLAALPSEHPSRLLLQDRDRESDLLEAAAGDESAAERLYRRGRAGRTRPISWEEMAEADARNREIGRRGEEIVDHLLAKQQGNGEIESYVWEARNNAASPFDFSLIHIGDQPAVIDVKTTPAAFGTRFFLSTYEVERAAREADPYYIYRVYELEGPSGPKLRRSSDISPLAESLLTTLAALPKGIGVSSIMVEADALVWDDPEDLELPPAPPAEAD